jgi:hypothetical protein
MEGSVGTEVDQSEYAMLRELIIEHLFIGEALRNFWRRRITDVEVLRSEIDAFGYDLVMSRGKIVRHIQLKTMKLGGKADDIKVSLKLMKKPSGCVVWIVVDPTTLNMESFLWFGGAPDECLSNITDLKAARHAKGDASGKKKERKDHRLVKRSAFEKVKALDGVLAKLFGALLEEMLSP